MIYTRYGYITTVLSSRGQNANDINVQVQLIGDADPVWGRLVNSSNSIEIPEDGTPCIVECINDENNLWVRTINDNSIIRILQGEKAIFDSLGNKIYLRKDGGVLIETLQGNITINSAGAINITGNVNITGNLTVSGTTELSGTTTIETKPFITHSHTGVTSGPSNTGGVL